MLRAGSLEAPKKWETLIHLVAEEAYDSAETGYNTDPLANDLDMLCCSALIYKIYKSLTNVYGSYAAYVF